MSMFEIFVILQVFAIGFICGQFYLAYKIRRTMQKIAQTLGIDLQGLEEGLANGKSTITVTKAQKYFTETTKNSILLFCKDSGKFVAQAEDLAKLAEEVYEHSKIRFATVKHNNEEFTFIEGKIVKNLEIIE